MKVTCNCGKLFYRHGKTVSNMIMIWCQFHGLDDEMMNHEIEFSFKNDHKKMKLSYPCVPLTAKPETIQDNYPIFTISTNLVRKLTDENGHFYYNIKIRCLKEEAKDEDAESGVSDVSD